VERSSAILNVEGEIVVPMFRDHRGLGRYASAEDSNLAQLTGHIGRRVIQWGPWKNDVHRLTADEKADILRRWLSGTDTTDTTDASEDPTFLHFFGKIMPGTCEWIEAETCFQSWLGDTSSYHPRILWLRGPAGTGKSVLASFVVRLIKTRRKLCQYFFIREEGSSPKVPLKSIFVSLALQLARHSHQFYDHLIALARRGENLHPNLEQSLWAILFLTELPYFERDFDEPIYWIIDGLDRCASLSRFISGLVSLLGLKVRLRILLLSRRTKEVSTQAHQLRPYAVVVDLNDIPSRDAAVTAFISSRLGCSASQALEVAAYAQGNFQAASLITDYLVLQPNIADLGEATEIASHVDIRPIWNLVAAVLIRSWTPKDLRRVKFVLTWVAYAKSPVTTTQISEIATTLKLELGRVDEARIKLVCGSVLTVDDQSLVRLKHGTLRDFLADTPPDHDLHLNPGVSHAELLRTCMQILLKLDMHGSDSFFRPGSLQAYAVLSWAHHLGHINPDIDDSLLSLIEEFLEGPAINSWIYLLAQIDQLDITVSASHSMIAYQQERQLAGAGSRYLDNILEPWATELLKLLGKFGGHLRVYPAAIDSIVPQFCPSSSLLRNKPCLRHGRYDLFVKGVLEQKWDDMLAKLSVPANPGMLVHTVEHIAISSTASSGEVMLLSTSSVTNIRSIFHGESVQNIQFSKSGSMLAIYGHRRLCIWKMEKQSPTWMFEISPSITVLAMAFGHDDQTVLVCSKDGEIWQFPLLEDPLTQKLIGLVCDTTGGETNRPLRCAAFNPDSTMVAVSYKDLPISVWTFSTSRVLRQHRQKTSRFQPGQRANVNVDSLSWTPTSDHILSVETDGSAWIWTWKATTQHDQERQISPPGSHIAFLKSSPTESFFVTGDRRGNLSVWKWDDLSLVYRGAVGGVTLCLDISSQGKTVYSLCTNACNVWGPICLHQLAHAGRLVRQPALSTPTLTEVNILETASLGTSSAIDVFAVGGLTHLYCTAQSRGELTVYNADGEMMITAPGGPLLPIRAMAWSDSERYLAVLDDRRVVRLYEVVTGSTWELRPIVQTDADMMARQLLFSKNEDSIILASTDELAVWHHGQDSQAHTTYYRTPMSEHTFWIRPTSPDRILGFRPASIVVFKLSTLELVSQIQIHLAPVDDPSLLKGGSSNSQAGVIGGEHLTGCQVNNAILSEDGAEALLQMSDPSCTRRFTLMIVDMSELAAAKSGQVQAIRATRYPRSILNKITKPLGYLKGTYSDSSGVGEASRVLAFIDTRGWLCTLSNIGRILNHGFLPHHWFDANCLRMAQITNNGTLFVPKGRSIGIVFNGFHNVVNKLERRAELLGQ